MRLVVDKAGRMVIPKPLRDQLHLNAGSELDARVEDGHLVATPLGPEVILVRRNGRLVATTTEPVAPLKHDDLLRLIDESRDWPDRD